MLAVRLIALLVATLGQLGETSTETLRVALISEFSGSLEPNSKKFVNGFKNFVAPYINTKGGMRLNGDTWLIEIIDYDTQSTVATTLTEIMANITAGKDMSGDTVGPIHAIVAATSSTNGPIKAAAQTAGILNIHASGGNPTTWSADQSFAFGMHLPFTTYTRGPIRMASIRGLKTIGIIRSWAHGFPQASCIAALEWARTSGLTVVGPSVAWCKANKDKTGECNLVTSGGIERCICGSQSTVDTLGYKYNIEEIPTFYELDENKIGNGLSVGNVDNETTDFVQNMFADMKAQGPLPDVILNFAFESHNTLNAMWKSDYAPKMVFGWQGNTAPKWSEDSTKVMNSTHGMWAVGFGQWHKAMTFADPLFGSNEEAVRLFGVANAGAFLDYDTAGAVAIGPVLYKVMKSYVSPNLKTMTLTEQRDELRKGVGQMNDETMWGLVRFNRNNQNSGRDTAAWQILPDPDGTLVDRCVLPSESAEVELQIPFPAWDARFGCLAGTQNDIFECTACVSGTQNPNKTAGLVQTQCTVCPDGVGTLLGSTGATSCDQCPAGHSNEDGTGVCNPCQTGTFRATDSASNPKCSRCAFGTYSDKAGSLSCEPCAKGFFQSDQGATSCLACKVGTIATGTGSSMCDSCVVGTFVEQEGKTLCESCSAGMTTLQAVQMSGSKKIVYLQGAANSSTCGCDEGFYASGGACVPCPKGMLCPIGSDIANLGIATPADGPGGNALKPYPVAPPGGWTSKAAPLSVYACRTEDNCPGGAPESCGAYLSGQACDQCDDAYRWNGQKCMPCSSVETTSVLFPVIPLLLAPAIILGMYKAFGDGIEKWESWQNSAACLLFIGLNHYQIANIANNCNIELPAGYSSVLDSFSVMNDIISIFKPECAGFAGFESDLITKAFIPVFLLLVAVTLKGVSFIVTKGTGNVKYHMDSNRLTNVFMSLMFTFFNAIVNLSLVLFKCSSNPNGEATLSVDYTITCWSSSKWQSMLVVGIICVLVYIIGFGGMFMRVVFIAPRDSNFGDRGFQMRWKFLFIKFRASVHWWSMAFLAKNFFLNVGLVVFTAGIQQMYWIMTVVIAYTVATMVFMPFRTRVANFAELASGVSIIYLVSMMTWFVDREDGTYDAGISDTSKALVFMPLVIIFFMILYVAYLGHHPEKLRVTRAKQHKYAVEHIVNFGTLTAHSKEMSAEFFNGVGEWDRFYIMHAAEVFAAELKGKPKRAKLVNSSSGRLEMLDRAILGGSPKCTVSLDEPRVGAHPGESEAPPSDVRGEGGASPIGGGGGGDASPEHGPGGVDGLVGNQDAVCSNV